MSLLSHINDYLLMDLYLCGFIRHRPSGPLPRIHLALTSSGVDLASKYLVGLNQDIDSICRINVESVLNRCQIDPRGGEGEADSRVRSGGSVPNEPLTTAAALRFHNANDWGKIKSIAFWGS